MGNVPLAVDKQIFIEMIVAYTASGQVGIQ
jgi:hypothetical protein